MNEKPNQFKQTQIIYMGLLVGQVLMGVMLFFLMRRMELQHEVESPFNLIIPAAAIIGIFGALFIQRKQMESLPTSATLVEKIAHYRKWNILKWAVAETGNLAALILSFLFGNLTTYVWFGVGVVMFGFFRPILEKFANDYQISQSEKESLG